MKTFRTYHLIMAFVSVGYIAALVLPFLLIVLYGFIGAMLDWQYIPYESLPFPSDCVATAFRPSYAPSWYCSAASPSPSLRTSSTRGKRRIP